MALKIRLGVPSAHTSEAFRIFSLRLRLRFWHKLLCYHNEFHNAPSRPKSIAPKGLQPEVMEVMEVREVWSKERDKMSCRKILHNNNNNNNYNIHNIDCIP